VRFWIRRLTSKSRRDRHYRVCSDPILSRAVRARPLKGLTFRTEMPAHRDGVCFNDDRCPLPKNWRRMSGSNLSRKALVSQDARTRPIAHRAAFETQIPTEVLRQNPSRSPVHHECGAGKAALPIPRRAVDRSQDRGRQSPDSRSAATSLESAPRGEREVLTAASQRWFPPASGLDALAPESGSRQWAINTTT